ncbi:MAG: hypothetical protein LRS43_03340, partial [Desulfurococcales archaeon]|nr:hypothetical protein [Desulfurococcales archaeon]
GDWLSRSVRSYSMGMRKKLALTTALAGDKHAIVLDEPYTLLDSKTVESLDRILARISRDKPVIVASHVHTRTLEEADKLIALVNGVVAYEKKRLTPLTSYKCTGSREELIELMKREAERIRKAEFTADNQLILDYTEPVKPPTDKCSPIIAVKPTLIEGK